ncbi:MAG: hypothetical protein RL404_150 [Pseudomonadota bacterium]|jgi:Flp pilus assembly protein TadG
MTVPHFVHRAHRIRRQRGATSVEFALVAAFGGFMVALFAAVEVARILFMMNSANEATELGARVAIVCTPKSSKILARMKDVLPSIPDANVKIDYSPAGCADGSVKAAQETCKSVTVSILPGWKVTATIPYVDFGFDMPAFTTTLPRESLDSTTCT